jgi:hypothetical protein
MKHFEETALEGATHKPLCWFCFVDDMFVIWPHGPGKLSEFLDYLNSIHESIQFTMETERDGHLPFLDNDIHSKPDGSLGHKVYRKPTHTNLYLNSNSHNYPSNKQAVLSTMVHRARSLCDQDSLHGELEFLRTTIRQNSYSDQQIRRALNPPARGAPTLEKPALVAFLPYVSMTFNHISRLLSRHNIKSVCLPPKDPQFPLADSRLLMFTVCPVSVVKSTSGRHAVSLRPGSRSTSATYVCSIQTNTPWLNTASTWATASNSRTHPIHKI